MIGGLSDTVEYGLEDRAIASMPKLLKQRYDIEVDGRLVRKYVNVAGREQELNMFGTGTCNGKRLFIVGEGKSKLSKKHVDAFIKLLDRLRAASVVDDNVFPHHGHLHRAPQCGGICRIQGDPRNMVL